MSHHAPSPRPAPRCVVLRHDLPNATWHFDWLLDPFAPADAFHDDQVPPLITYRTATAPWASGAFPATRAPDHRREYLTFEGPLSAGRGTVRRVWFADVLALRLTDSTLDVTLDAGGRPLALRGDRLVLPPQDPARPPESWRFVRVDPLPGAVC